jgi:hypothetical protein
MSALDKPLATNTIRAAVTAMGKLPRMLPLPSHQCSIMPTACPNIGTPCTTDADCHISCNQACVGGGERRELIGRDADDAADADADADADAADADSAAVSAPAGKCACMAGTHTFSGSQNYCYEPRPNSPTPPSRTPPPSPAPPPPAPSPAPPPHAPTPAPPPPTPSGPCRKAYTKCSATSVCCGSCKCSGGQCRPSKPGSGSCGK